MPTSKNTKNHCVKCNGSGNSSSLFTCNGCENMFCARHVIQHREELNNELELVVQQYDLIKDQLSQPSSNYTLLKETNTWEQKSLIKIQKIAELARNDLQQLINNSNQRLVNIFEDIESAISCDLVKDKNSPIYLIKIKTNNSVDKDINMKSSYTIEDKFGEIYGPVQLDRTGLRSNYIGDDWEYDSKLKKDNDIWQHGCHDELNSQSIYDKFQMGDILQLILNCKQQQIELYNQRTNTTRILHVNINQTPFPWKFLIGLRSSGDCVTIV